MLDERTRQSIEWIDKWFQEHGYRQDDTPMLHDLEQAIGDYLQSMANQGYSPKTMEGHRRQLNQFFVFIKTRRFSWD
ncbi:MAG: hypothetical protein KAT27_01870, partial [Desulfobacterales bacterium]|nr:hypothetical protein [Desulfobacterales bacterium]